MKRVRLLFILLFIASLSYAQSTRVRGRVTDAKTGETLPFVNIYFEGTTIGVSSDMDGMYNIETRAEVENITASFIGYEVQTVKINSGTFNGVNFRLMPLPMELNEVVVTPGENPAHPILKNVIKNKKVNNPDKIDSYFCSTYTKMELDLTNMTTGFKNKKLQKNFGFIFDYVDTSVITGQAYLPIMISEASADYYYKNSPSLSREIVKASRISGVEEDYTLAQFTGQLHGKVNFYDNYINIFNIQFASPISDHGLLYYKYFLIDSMSVDGRKTYMIRFHPKSVSTPVLDGEIQIDSLSWGLKYAKVKMMKGVNVNWIRHLVMENRYQLLNDTTWFPEQNNLFADFSLVTSDSSDLASFLGNRQVTYSDVKLSPEIPESVRKLDNNIIISKDVLKSDDAYWEQVRPYELSSSEQQIYKMVDSIKNVPLYQNIYTLISTIFGGYYDTKYIEIGPYYKLFNYNKLEGMHFQLGARTTSDFHKKLRLSGHGAYGTKDGKFKGGAGLEYVFNNMPTSRLDMTYRYDVMQLGAGVNAFTDGNVLNTVLSRGSKDKLSIVQQADISYEKEWRQGFSNTFALRYQDVSASKYVPFFTPDSNSVEHVRSTSLRLKTRISKDETVTRYNFSKHSLGSKYPIINIDMSMGVKGLFDNDHEYYRLEASVAYDFDIPPLGQSNIVINGGKIFGRVPYPLLKLHEGNGTFFYDPYAFSCMNYYEFASDTWASFVWEHHFRGFFLGRIPLMKKLNWREVFVFKGVIGTLSDKNNGSLPNTKAILLFPEEMSSVSKPYFEAGVGIENIFKIFRIDAIWRLSHRKDTKGIDTQNFTVSFSLHLKF
ncbi:DUF5686 and carboxypeptidase regulatory-like domain-containing protein [Porphyromonadaceae bacterium OttesenSCG-928-L07]|nr:DUF5686 and carboxypeptidase regulatory-like domain-containing protein [Porphyromonadaceae bacterium OttesenSCG-928-L07]MDL2251255.1 DUF5686 and carboxypeptidase regulatory-like domain-containing protein [Odoribacter sp. OttesenSCG-928-J03]